jgi:hypothetical protein
MKKMILAATIACLIAVSAHAQTTTPAPVSPVSPAPSSTTAAPSTRATPDANAPLPGANSFTLNQAKGRIEESGYTKVMGLAKDSNGVWRGTATKDGRSQNVAIDFRGNIVVGQK